MRRRTFLTTVGALTGGSLAGCLESRRGGSPTADDAPVTPEDTATPGEPDPTDAVSSPNEPAAAERWPQLAYDAANTRQTPARGPRDGAELAWDALGDRPVYPPAVDGDLYLTEAWTDGTAFALTADDGSETWSNSDLPPVRWAPAVSERTLLVLTRAEGNAVRLHGLDTATGDERWVREEGITASSGSNPPMGPTVRDGTLYIGSDRGILACEAATGSVEWTATLGEHVVSVDGGPTWRTDWATPAVTADRAVTFDTNDSFRETRAVFAVDRETGSRAWTAELDLAEGFVLQGHAVAGADSVFVSALDPHSGLTGSGEPWSGTERLFALDEATGELSWEWELAGKTLSPPAYAEGSLYVGEWDPDANTGRLHAVDAADGTQRWTYRTEAGGVKSPTVARDTLYIAQGRELAAVSMDGTVRWRLPLDERPGALVVVGSSVFVQTNPGHNDDSHLLAVREP